MMLLGSLLVSVPDVLRNIGTAILIGVPSAALVYLLGFGAWNEKTSTTLQNK